MLTLICSGHEYTAAGEPAGLTNFNFNFSGILLTIKTEQKLIKPKTTSYFNTAISPLPGFGALFHNCCTAIIVGVIINLVLPNIRSTTWQTKLTPSLTTIRLDLAQLGYSFKTIPFSVCVCACRKYFRVDHN